ncbi:MAG: acyl-coenzyme A thioesterase PaaI-like protein [Paraglaciecola sp.]|jgi:acyl-coenzyme A thioesterase PaaI-like protein
MSVKNPLRKFVDKINQYPAWLSSFLMTQMFRYKVKLAGTTGIEVLHTDGKTVTYRQKNKRKAQNHIGSVHAAAMALLAESCTGFIVGINLPGDKLPLIKTMKLNYVKRASGDMTAVASLTDEQIALMQTQEKGEVNVTVKVTDATGIVPVECEMLWAWVPKKK